MNSNKMNKYKSKSICGAQNNKNDVAIKINVELRFTTTLTQKEETESGKIPVYNYL